MRDPVIWVPNPEKGPPEIPLHDTIRAELVALTEESTDPIVVTYDKGQRPELWHVTAVLADDHPGGGHITITSVNEPDGNGGKCDMEIAVKVDFIFERLPPFEHRMVILRPEVEWLSETDHSFLRWVDQKTMDEYLIPARALGDFVPTSRSVDGRTEVLASKSCNRSVQHAFTLTSIKPIEPGPGPAGSCPLGP